MMEAEISIKGMRFWIVDIAAQFPSTVTVTECIPWRKRGGQALFTIGGFEGDVSPIIDSIRQHPEITSMDASERSDGQIVGSVAMKECWIIWTLVDCGCFLESAWSDGDGKAYFRILAGSEGSLPNLIRSVGSRGVDIEIIRIAQTSERPGVSRKQEKVIRLALEKGYFDYPRKITLEDLGKLCNMSTSTVFEIIKRGEKNILKQYFSGRK
jgi:predicted DNA binding protein